MKAIVDQDICIGCGACTGICPEVFEMGDEDIAVVIVDELTEEVMESAEQAKETCPVEAISVE